MNDNEEDEIYYRHEIVEENITPTVPKLPPDFDFPSPFNTIHEWLSNMCDIDHHEKPIEEYQFFLTQSPERKMLSLFGYNTYHTEANSSDHKIEFVPTHGYFPLQKEIYRNVSEKQLYKQILIELIEFTKTEKFQSSFLSKGEQITTGFSINSDFNRVFWPRSERNDDAIRKSKDTLINRFIPIDEKLKAFAERFGADLQTNSNELIIHNTPVPQDKVIVRRITWTDGAIEKGIFIQPEFTTDEMDFPTWNFLNLAWFKDGRSNGFWIKHLVHGKEFDVIEKNIDALLSQSENNLENVREEDLK